ncbi:MAG: cell wall-binding repeat-containing protein [Clostridiales bacterium]|nr:cell wall-binding repeat-containing protein [Clostridiales bacterium]
MAMFFTTSARRRATAAVAFLIALCAFLAAPLPALGLLVEMEVEELSAAARDVVVGAVLATASRADAEHGIVTQVTVRTEHALKGARSGDVTFRVPGGTLDGRVVYVPDAPVFTSGERVVVFLDRFGRVVGGRQGRLGVIGERVPEAGSTLSRIQARVTGVPYTGAACHGGGTTAAQTNQMEAAASGTVIAAASGPVISGITPGTAAAGIGDEVTIVGSGFGSLRGEVRFSTRSGGHITGDVISWSASTIRVRVPARRHSEPVASSLVAASSGPVRVVTSTGAVSAGHEFTVTFAYGGAKWTTPVREFYYDASGDTSGGLAAVRAAAQTWSAASGLELRYAGLNWLNTANHQSEVGWRRLEEGVLGRAHLLFFASTGVMVSADMSLNTLYSWGDGSGGSRDIESVALHEFGHWLVLLDLYGEADKPKVMYGLYSTPKRNLHEADFAGVQWLYGAGAGPDVVRVAGSNRYETALATSRTNFADGSARDVVIASGASFPDALSASGLAGSFGSPLLLTPPTTLNAGLPAELARLGATRVWLVGGTAAISAGVEEAIRGLGLAVERVSGEDRYGTAANVARAIASVRGASFANAAFVARGDDFADALAVAPYAYRLNKPVLLVRPADTSYDTQDAITQLGITELTLVGGTGAISTDVATELALLSGGTPVRLSGATRYSTAQSVVQHAIANGWASPAEVGVTAGNNFPDALGGGAAMGANGGIILLTPPEALCSHARGTLDAHAAAVRRVQIFGGQNAVGSAVYAEVTQAVGY